VFTPETFFIPLLNSLFLAGGCTVITVPVAAMAAYSLSRYTMRANKPFLYGVLFGIFLPINAIMVAVYALFAAFNLIDSLPGTIVFIGAWGNFLVPFVLLFSPDKLPAAVSIFSFFGQFGTVAYGQLAAFALLYSLPVVTLYVFVSRVLGGSSAMAGAIKG
jgi:multiple sugar transport system permease protein